MAINTSKVIVGGIIGGIVANVIDFISSTYILGGMQTAAMTKLNPSLAVKPSGTQIAGFLILDFVWIIATVWVYAAIRPRFGPGPKTAAYAGIASWVIGSTVAGFFCVLGLFGSDLFVAASVVALINAIVSTMVGARFYTEESVA
jgi:hypothetical protein